MGYGVASGFVTGALTGAISYHIDDEYAWGVDKNVLEYGNDNNRLADAAKYVSPGDYDVRLTADGGSEFDAPSVVLFEKHLFAASFLVLIFSKKAGFSLGKIKKVADSVQHSH